MADIVEMIQGLALEYSLNLLGSIVILVLGIWGTRLATNFIKRLMWRAQVDDTLITFVGNVAYFGILAVVIIAALGNLGVQTASLVAVIGAAGLAVGLALQGSLSNFAAGVMIIMFRPFRVGDLVEIADVFGEVKELQIVNTVVVTRDNKTAIIPNAAVTADKIINYSTLGILRVDMVFGIGYDDDLRQAKSILEELVRSDSRILEDPAPDVAVMELADSSVNFAVRPYVAVADYWGVYFYLTEQVKLRFDAEGISIPYPQQDMHIVEAELPPLQMVESRAS